MIELDLRGLDEATRTVRILQSLPSLRHDFLVLGCMDLHLRCDNARILDQATELIKKMFQS